MDNLKNIVEQSNDFHQFAKGYFQYISILLGRLDTQKVHRLVKELESARENGNTVYIIGNGGSASTASHMANDWGFGTRTHVDPPLRILSLTDNMAVKTALANDTGFENVFVRQLQLHYRPGDKLIAISVSGHSPNLVEAAKWMKSKNAMVMSLLGVDGGQLKDLSDISVVVETPKGEYGPVEDVHMILDHLIYTWIWYKPHAEAFNIGTGIETDVNTLRGIKNTDSL